MNTLPQTGYLRLKQILEFLPMSKTIWYKRVKDGKAPQPTKLGARISVWRVEDIREIPEQLAPKNAAPFKERTKIEE